MRLTDTQIQNICNSGKKIFGENCNVWLFGSRVDDAKKGGDIDLFFEVDPTNTPGRQKIKLAVMLEDYFGEQKIDLVLHQRNTPEQPIHQWAKHTGVQLC